MSETSEKNGADVFIDNISEIKNIISKKSAYNITLLSVILFGISLFLSWSQATSTENLRDSGISSGWSEQAYFCIIPLLFVALVIFSGKIVSIGSSVGSFVASIALLVYNNIINRTTWNETESRGTYTDYGTYMESHKDVFNVGSDLGIGFWIGLISLFALGISAIAWSVHTYNDKEESNNLEDNESTPLKMDFNGVDVKANLTKKGIYVNKDSYVMNNSLDTCEEKNVLNQRDKMIEEGTLKREGDKIYFMKDVLFSSPRIAAQFLIGDPEKGKTEWKNNDGIPFFRN